MSLQQSLYKQLIQDHASKPRHFGILEDAHYVQDGFNPSCGDQVKLMLQLEQEIITAAQFTGKGCAISLASASLMTMAIKGKTLAQAQALAAQFSHMIRTGETDSELGDLMALQGVHILHTRVKCATLCWQALEATLNEVNQV